MCWEGQHSTRNSYCCVRVCVSAPVHVLVDHMLWLILVTKEKVKCKKILQQPIKKIKKSAADDSSVVRGRLLLMNSQQSFHHKADQLESKATHEVARFFKRTQAQTRYSLVFLYNMPIPLHSRSSRSSVQYKTKQFQG